MGKYTLSHGKMQPYRIIDELLLITTEDENNTSFYAHLVRKKHLGVEQYSKGFFVLIAIDQAETPFEITAPYGALD